MSAATFSRLIGKLCNSPYFMEMPRGVPRDKKFAILDARAAEQMVLRNSPNDAEGPDDLNDEVRAVFNRAMASVNKGNSSAAMSHNEDERSQIIAEILVALFGDEADNVAEEITEDDDESGNGAALAVGSPKVKRRYGKRPGPGWTHGGTSANGKAIWLHGTFTGAAHRAPAPHVPHTPTPVPPPPVATPPHVPSPVPPIHPHAHVPPPGASAPTPPPPVAVSTLPSIQQVAATAGTGLPAGGKRARAVSIAAHGAAMAKLNAGQPLTAADKATLSRQLTNMPTPLLHQLHGALGGKSAVANTKAAVASVKAILTSTGVGHTAPTPAPAPAPAPAPVLTPVGVHMPLPAPPVAPVPPPPVAPAPTLSPALIPPASVGPNRTNFAGSGTPVPVSLRVPYALIIPTIQDLASGKALTPAQMQSIDSEVGTMTLSQLNDLSDWVGGPDLTTYWLRSSGARDLKAHLDKANLSNISVAAVPPPPVAPVPVISPPIAPPATPTADGGDGGGTLAKATAPVRQTPINLATAPVVDYAGKNGAQVDHTWGGLDYPGVTPKYGAIVSRVDPATGKVQVLLAKPKGYYGNTSWTWAKGSQDAGEDAQGTATREAYEEIGAQGDIVGHLSGTYTENNKSGLNAYFIMRQTGTIDDKTWKANGETEAIEWVDIDKADAHIKQTAEHVTDSNGMKAPSFVNWQRDADVLEQAKAALIPGYVPKVNRRVDVLPTNLQVASAEIRAIALAASDGHITTAQATADIDKVIANKVPTKFEKDVAGAMRAGVGTGVDFLNAVIKADPGHPVNTPSPPGPPPRPGLVWNPTTHRWILAPVAPPSVPTPPSGIAPIMAPRPGVLSQFVPKTSNINKGDYEHLDHHVDVQLSANLGMSAEDALKQGMARTIHRNLSGILDYSVGQYEIERTLRHLWAQQTTVPIPAQFDHFSTGRKKNPLLPNEARPKLTPDETTAVQKWTSSAYIPWARALRETGAPPPQFAKADADMQSAFAKAKLFTTPVAVERHLTLSATDLASFVANAQQSMTTGQPVAYDSYQATSTDPVPPNFHGNVEMRINAIHGLDIGPHHHHPHVKELLLNHQSQFKVTSVQQVGNKWVISYDQLPPANVPKKRTPKAVVASHMFSSDIKQSSAVKDFISGKINISDPITDPTTGRRTGGVTYTLLNAILTESGRNGKPQVVDAARIANLKSSGWPIGFRSVTQKKFTDMFRDDDVYLEGGSGMRAYGHGVYYASYGANASAASDDNAKMSSEGYGNHTMRIALDPSARVIKWMTLQAEQAKANTQLTADLNAGTINRTEYNKLKEIVDNEGLFAALNNYDAIDTRPKTSDYWVLLNRTVVAVQKDNVK